MLWCELASLWRRRHSPSNNLWGCQQKLRHAITTSDFDEENSEAGSSLYGHRCPLHRLWTRETRLTALSPKTWLHFGHVIQRVNTSSQLKDGYWDYCARGSPTRQAADPPHCRPGTRTLATFWTTSSTAARRCEQKVKSKGSILFSNIENQ